MSHIQILISIDIRLEYKSMVRFIYVTSIETTFDRILPTILQLLLLKKKKTVHRWGLRRVECMQTLPYLVEIERLFSIDPLLK